MSFGSNSRFAVAVSSLYLMGFHVIELVCQSNTEVKTYQKDIREIFKQKCTEHESHKYTHIHMCVWMQSMHVFLNACMYTRLL